MGAVGTQVANLTSDFNPRTYSLRKLSDLARKTNVFDVERLEVGHSESGSKSQGSEKKT